MRNPFQNLREYLCRQSGEHQYTEKVKLKKFKTVLHEGHGEVIIRDCITALRCPNCKGVVIDCTTLLKEMKDVYENETTEIDISVYGKNTYDMLVKDSKRE